MAAACVGEFVRLADRDLSDSSSSGLTDQDLADVMTAAVRLYAFRAETREAFPAPLNVGRVTATDVAIAVSEMVRVVDLNMFDLSMWHGRRHGQGR
jgi:hypothetical protein